MHWHGRLALVLLCATTLVAALLLQGQSAQAQTKNAELQVMFLDGVSIRSSPSYQSEEVGKAKCGSILTTLDAQEGSWFKVRHKGNTGWVNGYLVTFDHEAEAYCHAYAPQEVLVNAGLADPPPPPTVTESVSQATGYNSIEEIICQAALNYGQSCQAMIAVASCESTLNPGAVGGLGEIGLFQFLPSTWATTPFAGQSAYDPVANANAAAWMWSQGRRGEWYC